MVPADVESRRGVGRRRARRPLPDPSILISSSGELAGEAGEADALGAAVRRAGLIHDDEMVILLIRPSPLYIVLASLGGLAFIAVISLALAYMARLPWVGWTDTQAFSLGVALVGLRLGWQSLEWWSRLYILTDRRIVRRMGVLRVAIFETQLSNIQHTGVFTQLRERMCGLGTIGFATAGSHVFEAFWVMLPEPLAVHQTILGAMRRYGRK